MPLIAIFGINASGKDTIANIMKNRFSDCIITSESRLLMYYLDITPSYETSYLVDKNDYLKLQNAPQKKITSIVNKKYEKILLNLRSNNNVVLFLYHLVFTLTTNEKKPKYSVDRKIPLWLTDMCDGFIQLKCNPKEIIRRRIYDKKNTERDRGFTCLKEVIKHQKLCDKKWDQLIKSVPHKKHTIIINSNLEIASKKAENFIKDVIKKNKRHNISQA